MGAVKGKMAHIHHVPGRLRVRITTVKGNASVGASVERALSTVSGVVSARSNHVTGSVVVAYDCEQTDASAILCAIRNGGWMIGDAPDAPDTQTFTRRPDNSAANRLATKAVRSVAWYLLEVAVERSVPKLLAALL